MTVHQAQNPMNPGPHPGNPAGGAIATQTSRLRVENLSETDRNVSLLMHVSPLLALIMPPISLLAAAAFVLVAWLVKREGSGFVDDHGREMLNMLFSGLLFTVVLAITVIGVLPLLAWYVVIVINMIRGAMAASRSEYFRYPMVLRFI